MTRRELLSLPLAAVAAPNNPKGDSHCRGFVTMRTIWLSNGLKVTVVGELIVSVEHERYEDHHYLLPVPWENAE